MKKIKYQKERSPEVKEEKRGLKVEKSDSDSL
jgi:hypothetical protein